MKITRIGSVYLVRNKSNNKFYVGKTTQKFKSRKLQHLGISRTKKDRSYFHNAIRKYGEDNFEWTILEQCNSKEELNLAEEWYIRYYDTYNNGYNMTYGGDGISGWKHTDKIKKKISRKTKENWSNKEYAEKVNTKERNKKIAKTMSKVYSENWNNDEWRQKRTESIRKGVKSIECRKKHKDIMNKRYENPIERQEQGERLSKNWIVISPIGLCTEIKNLKNFCRNNNLNITGMWRTYKGIQNTYKGWKCIRVGGGSN